MITPGCSPDQAAPAEGHGSLAAQEWIRQGKAEGIVEGKFESILITLETRFGAVPKDIEIRVRQAAPEKLDGMLRRALTRPSLQAFFPDEFRH
jgi:hypothetical protein